MVSLKTPGVSRDRMLAKSRIIVKKRERDPAVCRFYIFFCGVHIFSWFRCRGSASLALSRTASGRNSAVLARYR